ncbi:MAG: hypothetical protein AAFU65_02550, partial [Pseudomonadota bacterium]
HDWMYGVIYVIDTPYYAISNAKGRAKVARPDGQEFELTVWHPDQAEGGITRQVALDADNTQGMDIRIDLRPTAPRPSRPPPIEAPEPY